MNILFVSLSDWETLTLQGLYTDLLRCMQREGHAIYAISPVERRTGRPSHVVREGDTLIVKPRIGNIQKTGIIEKGISTVMLGSDLRRAVKRELSDVRFDLVLYPTPPITFLDVVEYVKRRDGATTYLMLKDIFPQNALDIGMMSERGPKGLLWRHFRRQERHLYEVSDYIGCMSPANVAYLLAQNPGLDTERVGLCPNALEPVDMRCDEPTRAALRERYGIPQDKVVFVYGGNLGRPQDIGFVIDCLRAQRNNERAFFLIIGNGTEYRRLEAFFRGERPPNAMLLRRLPKDDYNRLVGSCDAGLIFLDHRFTIPNFPSRLLSYMQAGIPVLCATDNATDVGRTAEEGGFGVTCSSARVEDFSAVVERMLSCDLRAMGQVGYDYMREHYNARDWARRVLTTVSEIRGR